MIAEYVKRMIGECSDNYGLDIHTKQGKHLGIVYVYNKLLSLMPFNTSTSRSLIINAISDAVGLKNRSVRYYLETDTVEYRRAEYLTRTWETKLFDVGTFHNVQSIEWYEKQSYLLQHTGLVNQSKHWKKGRFAERLIYCGRPVMISSINGNKYRIAQDGGINEWSILELMGKETINEGQGTSDTDSLR